MRSTIQYPRGVRVVMSSPRVTFFILFVLLPILASGRGGRGGGGRSGGGSRGGGFGGSHSYPSGGGLSGNSHQSQSHGYPHSTGLSGTSGSNSRPHNTYKTEVHHHHYSPPQQVHYGSGYHPVYHGTPPVYVYTYRDSGSRYNTLLTGLALYNLGRMSSHHDHHYYSHAETYRGPSGEVCELQIVKSNGEYERTKINCQLISSFIIDAEREREQEQNRVVTTNTNTVTNTTVHKMEHSDDNSSEVITTTTVQNTTVVDALEAKGPPLTDTPGMRCFMVRRYSGNEIKKKIECGLLYQYARSSFPNGSSKSVPVLNIVILLSSVLYIITYM